MARYYQDCESKIKKTNEDKKYQINLNKTKLKNHYEAIVKENKDLKSLVKSQKDTIKTLQEANEDRFRDIKHLTSNDERIERLKELQCQFTGITEMVSQHEQQIDQQIMLLDEYTRMIDIGIQKIPRFDQAP